MKIFNLYTDTWDHTEERPSWRAKATRVGRQLNAELIGGGLYELEPGNKLWPYHTHHANEEWVIVLRGEPTLRTHQGEQQLRQGDVVAFPRGKEGAHQIRNDTAGLPGRHAAGRQHGDPRVRPRCSGHRAPGEFRNRRARLPVAAARRQRQQHQPDRLVRHRRHVAQLPAVGGPGRDRRPDQQGEVRPDRPRADQPGAVQARLEPGQVLRRLLRRRAHGGGRCREQQPG